MSVIHTGKNPPIWIIVLASLPVGCVSIGFIFLLIFDRNKLQSEDYQIRNRSLDIIQEKGDKFPILGTSIDSIANPDALKLPKKTKTKK